MIHLSEVHQFMNDEVVNERRSHHDEMPIEVNIGFAAARTPTTTDVFDTNLVYLGLSLRCPVAHFGLKYAGCQSSHAVV